jgi:hypothetical protein
MPVARGSSRLRARFGQVRLVLVTLAEFTRAAPAAA